MTSKLKYMVSQLDKGKNLEENLPEFIQLAAKIYHRYSTVRLMMDYYVSFESACEGTNPYTGAIEEEYKEINKIVETLYVQKAGEEERIRCQEELIGLRGQIMEKMGVIIAYIDRFSLYEYIFNRLEYRFREMEAPVDDEALTKEIVQFIFKTKDNVAINENIHLVIGQLPVRMSKGKYFDRVKNSLSVYEDSDKQALYNYLYMFRTSAMLYNPPGMDSYFREFGDALKEFDALDYGQITKEQYTLYSEKLANLAGKLKDLSDLYMVLQQIINHLLTISYAADLNGKANENEPAAAGKMIAGVLSLYQDTVDAAVWNESSDKLETEEEKLDWLAGMFTEIEGIQEEEQEHINLIQAVVTPLAEGFGDKIQELGLSSSMAKLQRMEDLTSASLFISFEETENGPVEKAYLKEETEKLLKELEELFSDKGRYLKRAVMAATLERMPVFFQTPQEVADYIYASLSGCSDMAEKYAVSQILEELML